MTSDRRPTAVTEVTDRSDRAGHSTDREAPDGGASRRVRHPSPCPAPRGAGTPAREAGEVSGPGVPNETWFTARLRRRKREPEQRQHRTHPRFSDTEWAAITTAAQANHCQPGTFTALATVLAAGHEDPRAAVADFHSGIQHLGQATTALDRIGTLLNQEAAYLHRGGALHAEHQRLLARIEQAVEAVETTAVRLVRD